MYSCLQNNTHNSTHGAHSCDGCPGVATLGGRSHGARAQLHSGRSRVSPSYDSTGVPYSATSLILPLTLYCLLPATLVPCQTPRTFRPVDLALASKPSHWGPDLERGHSARQGYTNHNRQHLSRWPRLSGQYGLTQEENLSHC
jgi:hypothetical protein